MVHRGSRLHQVPGAGPGIRGWLGWLRYGRAVRIAALDLGSNSFHLLVADVAADGSVEAVARDKEMLRLGSQVARHGTIGEEAGRGALDVVRRFAALAESVGADQVVACGTAALRRAADAPALLARMAEETGISVRVISGEEEARLIFGAVQASVVIDPAPAMAMDLGGGSLELTIGDQSTVSWSTSLELGVARLSADLVRSDPPSAGDRRRVVRAVEDALAPHLPAISEARPRMGIGSSGTLTTLVRLAAGGGAVPRPASAPGTLGRPGGINQPRTVNQLSVALDQLRDLEVQLLSQSSAARASLPGVDARRADLLPAGVITAVTVMELTRIDRLTGCEWALREGMVLDAARSRSAATSPEDPAALRRRSVLDLCRRCRWPEVHSRKVARLAIELFDGTRHRHRLGPEDRQLLEFGALLHDVGEHVSTDNHDQHSAYLIAHGRLRGFSPEEVAVLACLGRFHRQGSPKGSFEPWAAMPAGRRARTVVLVALLQAADALDRGHGGPVRAVTVRDLTAGDAGGSGGTGGEGEEGGVLELAVDAEGDISLERWGLARKTDLLQQVLACRVELTERAAVPAA